jgi:hypothetical protein
MESRSEKIRAALQVFLVAVSKRPARWYRLRRKNENDEYSLSFLCGIPQTRLDALLLECDFLQARGTILRVAGRDFSQFLEASVAGTELVQSRVKGGPTKEYFICIGTFGTSPPFTAIHQLNSGMKSLQCPRTAGITFRQSLNEGSETTTEQTIEKTTKETTEKTTEEPTTAKKTTEETTEGTTKLTTEGTMERPTTAGTTEPTLPCTGWSGEAHRKVIYLSTTAAMQDRKNIANFLSPTYPLCGSFRTREGYNKRKGSSTAAALRVGAHIIIASGRYHNNITIYSFITLPTSATMAWMQQLHLQRLPCSLSIVCSCHSASALPEYREEHRCPSS